MSETKHYVGEVGADIIIDMAEVITGATGISMLVKKPDGTTATWAANIYPSGGSAQYIKHTVVAGDFDQAGMYEVHPVMTLASWTGKGEKVSFIVFDLYS